MNNRHLSRRLFKFLFPIVIALQISSALIVDNPNHSINRSYIKEDNFRCFFEYIPQKDSLFYLGDEFLEINLGRQIGYFIQRSGYVDTFSISSGNKYLPRGLETPTGLFSVQNKAPVQISRQFENAEMLNWIGFHGNFGFHGLKKRGYYNHLGRRPSSHGCVRMSVEDGERLYPKIKIGIPVLIYNNEPSRIIVFGKLSDFDPNFDILITNGSKSIYKILNKRLKNLHKRKYLLYDIRKVFLDKKLNLVNSNIVSESNYEISFFPRKRFVYFDLSKEKPLTTNIAMFHYFLTDTCKIEKR
ncbi:MAG: L,D-transpeptidase [Ignavibacteria bacterium]|nr:L,D-transpeptidase [Ignavibacteria bacterium]